MTLKTPLTPVDFAAVTFTDRFLAPRIKTNRESTIPTIHKQLRATGRLAAWDGRWRKGDPNPPHVFWDSDIAKWIEGAAYSLKTHPDKKLERALDALIAGFAKLQRRDGYLNSHYAQIAPQQRFNNLRDRHELYCAGHLIEAAIAYFDATGKRAFLDAMRRYADHIDATFGPERGKLRGYCGHQEIELALVKLHRATGEARYLKLAQFFIEERGRGRVAWSKRDGSRERYRHYYDAEATERGEDPSKFWAKTYEYLQAHKPVRLQTQVVGHAVRAMYMYCGMADLELLGAHGGAPFMPALEKLWAHLTTRRMYVTGGIGPSAANEGFTSDYDLPDETAYAETCAGIGLIYWAHRMLQLTGDGVYADALERALYNNVLAGVSLDGTLFNYVNPLASRGAHHRQSFFTCACCPPNVVRLLASLGQYAYSTDADGVWVHLYAQSRARLDAHGAVIAQRAAFPAEGRIDLALTLDAPKRMTVRLRVPGWSENSFLRVNGGVVEAADAVFERGYLHLAREWRSGDTITLDLDLSPQLVRAHPAVPQALGRVALQRGPLVYCVEQVDNGAQLDALLVGSAIAWEEQPRRGSALPALIAPGLRVSAEGWDGALYRTADPNLTQVRIVAVPYCEWDNRTQGEMRVWMRAA
jgi:uncharacterized protein